MKVSTILGLVASASCAFAESLRELANGFPIGVAGASAKFNDEAYMEALSQFNTMVAENGCKLSSIQPEQGVYDFSDCDAHLAKAEELGMKFRGHCLIWFNYQPEWFQNVTGYDNMKNTIVDHITNVLTHYKGKIDTWDVVNEAIEDESTGENGTWELRDTFISRECPDFIDIAFKTAREVDPSVKLFYNDYDIEGVDIRNGKKTNAVYNFVKDMIARGVPIDGVGLQYHLHTDKTVQYDNVMETMRRFGELGLEVQITEMDVNSVEGNTEESFALQGKLYGEGLRACLDSPNCTAFLIWGVGDSDSWRKDGYPLAFNADYTPKPAYYAMIDVLKEYNTAAEDSNDSADEVDANAEVDAEVDSAAEDSADEQN
ncbi:glycoside hydrolase [Neocallimastix lanati (nom. inval.)]|jgi:endo-1,4-beta-xylanase|uniref:Beta-xylanase n=1 Tax=Neocallimastix californiae TaxID=1754190 RepID=A0A1Y2F9K7_9FUNG|nr:glycoside hydrolase [Neocallimastix sp. JGI-2020a]ORY79575.1 glycoside hydrolase [Neocallimastix californiae]|eukprot:ORY79575.1 glycoside hydrolase [Neocallimastix californiae]